MQQQNGYVLLVMISTLLSGAAALYVWRRRSAAGASSSAWLLLSISIWSYGYAMELASADLSMMRFWLRVEYLGISFLPLWILRFAFQYTGRDEWLTRRNTIAMSVIPVLTLILNWTNEWHGFFYRDISVDTSRGMAVLALSKGIWYWVHLAYVYGAFMLAAFLVLRLCWRRGRLYRVQAFTLLIAMLLPVLANALYLTHWNPFPNLDLSPFAFTATGILIIWGLYRYRLFDVTPVARDMLIECMSDGVLVLDSANCVVDINPVARRLTGIDPSSAIGQEIDTLLPAWAELLTGSRGDQKAELKSAEQDEAVRCLDLRTIQLKDHRGAERGKLIILRDITAEKQLEAEREELIGRLKDALAQVKKLSGLLPICAHCKKIRDDQGYWHQVEMYIHDHSEAEFTHGICPDCAEKLYPEYHRKKGVNKAK